MAIPGLRIETWGTRLVCLRSPDYLFFSRILFKAREDAGSSHLLSIKRRIYFGTCKEVCHKSPKHRRRGVSGCDRYEERKQLPSVIRAPGEEEQQVSIEFCHGLDADDVVIGVAFFVDLGPEFERALNLVIVVSETSRRASSSAQQRQKKLSAVLRTGRRSHEGSTKSLSGRSILKSDSASAPFGFGTEVNSGS